ncbi:helix-turn-helix transcriptional regulator [Spirosoma sp. BT702]|uniref:Helix-turn-helix transcriptional regulator n=1 Tax=Spirosoma profusum TaxID=2771354 RepID=A0A926XV95_9BACT|nr:AraC family transcriptional regulator [Spirosoma profusum]MBD2700480.1 helix-turn-helix transcriptional regulator [Spirosoma profusum]
MAFVVQGMTDFNFQHVNHFFLTETRNPALLEHAQHVQLPDGQVFFKEWYFEGIRMCYSDWTFAKPTNVYWHYDISVELVTLQLNLNGCLLIEDKKTHCPFLLQEHHHNLFYSNTGLEQSGVLKPTNSRITVFIVQFTKEKFLALTQGANEALNRFGENVLNGKPAALSPVNLPLEASLRNVIHNILHCGYSEGLKKMFLLAKAIEFLVIQAEASNAVLLPAYKYLKTSQDRERIMYAQEYIMKNLDAPPSLTQLSRIVGINEYKLKRGFKEFYNNTVFGYLAEARLEIARNDLVETNKKAIEIASDLGYSSLQHFSHAFKKKFGYSPKTVKKKT